jgi:hypothetical protein
MSEGNKGTGHHFPRSRCTHDKERVDGSQLEIMARARRNVNKKVHTAWHPKNLICQADSNEEQMSEKQTKMTE